MIIRTLIRFHFHASFVIIISCDKGHNSFIPIKILSLHNKITLFFLIFGLLPLYIQNRSCSLYSDRRPLLVYIHM